jgi:uncharacterized protein DUF4266
VQGSRSSSESRLRAWVSFSCAVLLALALTGCATVRPEDKEFLAEPSMTWSAGGIAKAHEDHVIENREGSFGGGGAKGGGCGCN